METTLPASALARSLDAPGDYDSPAVLLGDLTSEQANRKPVGAPYSIAEVVAHMHVWQDFIVRRARGQDAVRPEGDAADWPAATPETWPVLRADFLHGVGEFKTLLLTDDAAALTRIYGDDVTHAERLLNIALHGAYHLGQIALLRRELGLWPPADGDDTA